MRIVLPTAGRFRSLPFWKQATITTVSVGVLVVLWSACGGTYTPPPPPPLSSPRVELRARHGAVFALAFSPTGEWLASGTSDKNARLWDVSKSEVLRTMSGHTGEITSLAASPDGKILATGSTDKTIRLWDTSTGNEIHTLAGHTGGITSVAFSPDGRLLASSSSDSTVIVWDVSSGNQLRKLVGHSDKVNGVAFSPDGRLLASASNDKTARLWDCQTGKAVRTMGHESGISAVAFSPDGRLLATGTAFHHRMLTPTQGGIFLWNVETGTVEDTVERVFANVRALAFSPDGRVLAGAEDSASPSANSVVTFWAVKKRTMLSRFDAERHGQLHAIAFSPDGRWLASGGQSGRIRLWQ